MASSFAIILGGSENPIEYPGTTNAVLDLECRSVSLYRYGPAFAQRLNDIKFPPPAKKALDDFARTFAINIGFRSEKDTRTRIACTSSPALTEFLSLTGDAVSHTLEQHPNLTPNQLRQVRNGINSLLGPCGYDITIQFPIEGR